MSENLFFERKKLRSCGTNVIIGKTARIRYPELVEIGDNVIIDDFVYISTALKLASWTHIAAGCKLIGGRAAAISLDSFATLAPNVVLAAGSDDYIGGLATPMVPIEFKGDPEIGRIELGRHCIVGANSTILPNVIFEDGASLGAQSLAKERLLEWRLYGGIPSRELGVRNREKILMLEERFKESMKS
ncbi:MAG: hypothetical protein KIS62_06205 [Ramlibacter sp.]|nr:hypothetical protein [Ramlibacter sp.]